MTRANGLLAFLLVLPVCAQEAQRPDDERSKLAPAEETDASLRMTPAVRAVQRAADSVVSIYIKHRNQQRDLQLDGQGSGVILDESGLVITNWHVVTPALQDERFKVEVILRSDKSFFADVLSSSPEHDLALLQLRLSGGEKVKPVVLGDSDTLMIGEDVLAIGNPQGNANTVSKGILSAINRQIQVRAPDGQVRRYVGLLQTDAAINLGNSGGALLDISGKLIGINNAMAQGAENIGFAIPVNTMRRVFENILISSESLASVWTGFRVKDVDGKPQIVEVHPGGPAARSGLVAGDVVVQAGGQAIHSALDLARTLIRVKAGEPLALVIDRSGRQLKKTTVPTTANAATLARLGLDLEEITREKDLDLVRRTTRAFRDGLGLRVPQGMLLPVVLRVRTVYPDTPAADLKLQPGDILLAMPVSNVWGRSGNFAVFKSADDLANMLRTFPGTALPIEVLRGDEIFEGELSVRR